MSRHDDAAPFPFALIRMLDRDRDGKSVSFSYARETGSQSFVIGHLREMLEPAPRTPAKYCKQILVNAAELVILRHEIFEEIGRQWSAHLDRLSDRREARAAEARALEVA